MFRYSYLLKRDDEIFLGYSATQQTIKLIIESKICKDIIN